MTSCDNSPHEVGQDIPFLFLATAVGPPSPPAHSSRSSGGDGGYDGIGTLAATVALINEVVDLPGGCPPCTLQRCPPSWGPKTKGGQAAWERRKVHLLGIVNTEVHCKVCRTRGVGSKGRAASCSVSSLGILYHVLVEGTLHEY